MKRWVRGLRDQQDLWRKQKEGNHDDKRPKPKHYKDMPFVGDVVGSKRISETSSHSENNSSMFRYPEDRDSVASNSMCDSESEEYHETNSTQSRSNRSVRTIRAGND